MTDFVLSFILYNIFLLKMNLHFYHHVHFIWCCSSSLGYTVIFAFSKKNPVEAFNSTDAEINAAFYMAKLVAWLCQIMEDLGIPNGV